LWLSFILSWPNASFLSTPLFQGLQQIMLFIRAHRWPSGDFLTGPVTAHAILCYRIDLADTDTR